MKRYFLLIATILFLSISCKQNGYKIEYEKSSTGEKYISSEGNYIDGKKDGVWKVYNLWGGHTYGLWWETTYKNGIEEGLYKSYRDPIVNTKSFRPNTIGHLSSEGYYKDGKEDGIWKYYFYEKSGQLKKEEEYKDGLLLYIKNYYINGQLSWTRKYDDGEEVYTKCWDEDGNEINCDEMKYSGC